MHSLAASYGQRPSGILGLDPRSWEAYQLDVATLQAGRYIENKLSERDKDGRPLHTLQEILTPQRAESKATQYRSMSRPGIRKVRIKPDGTWDD